jgi:hypothetical protein
MVDDSIGFNGRNYLDPAGDPASQRLHLIERWTVQDSNTLQIEFTIDDPAAFSKPWTAKRVWEWRPDVRFYEYVCEENNRNAPDANGVLRNF